MLVIVPFFACVDLFVTSSSSKFLINHMFWYCLCVVTVECLLCYLLLRWIVFVCVLLWSGFLFVVFVVFVCVCVCLCVVQVRSIHV